MFVFVSQKNPVLVNEIQSDLHSECSKFGDVSKVTIYDVSYV